MQSKAARRHAHDFVGRDRLGAKGHLLRLLPEVDLLEGEGIFERQVLCRVLPAARAQRDRLQRHRRPPRAELGPQRELASPGRLIDRHVHRRDTGGALDKSRAILGRGVADLLRDEGRAEVDPWRGGPLVPQAAVAWAVVNNATADRVTDSGHGGSALDDETLIRVRTLAPVKRGLAEGIGERLNLHHRRCVGHHLHRRIGDRRCRRAVRCTHA
eukprot:scaffold63919_cov55-Phaeocystis_antarctica.AAC.2